MKFRSLFLVTSALLILLEACSGSTAPTAEGTIESIPEALDDAAGMSKAAMALKKTGIADIFAGQGSYTFLAPIDSAFGKLGSSDNLFESDEGLPALAALLRLHIVPGYLSPADISAAIKAAPDGKVTMRAMDGSELVFTASGDELVVTGQDGVGANLTGEPISSNLSIAIPVDAVLKVP